jgi:hypothetical protein
MHARQPMHRVLSWIIAFGLTVDVVIYASLVRRRIFTAETFFDKAQAGRRTQRKERKFVKSFSPLCPPRLRGEIPSLVFNKIAAAAKIFPAPRARLMRCPSF